MRRTTIALLLAASALLAPAAGAADDFYVSRLQEGRVAFQTGRTAEAADLLRIACFGLMDNPPLYSEGIVWLGLAQERQGRTADVDATLRRFLEAEKRFGGYNRIVLPADVRKEFDGVLVRRLPQEVLLSLPSLVRLVETEEQKLAKMPPAERARALAAKAKTEPGNVKWPLEQARLALGLGQARDAVRFAGQALALDPASVEALQLRARALTARRDYPAALADLAALPPGTVDSDPALRADLFVGLAAGRRWDEARAAARGLPEEQLARADVTAALGKMPREEVAAVPEAPAGAAAPGAAGAGTPAVAAVPAGPVAPVAPVAPGSAPAAPQGPTVEEVRATVRELLAAGKAEAARNVAAGAVAARPDDRDLRRLHLEAACMAKDWKQVAAEAQALVPFRAGEEPSMFYAAVGFYETGRKDEARPLMERARPAIAATPFVNYYAERILR
jgi:tetratricopeptide (TPR) repeat protein